LTPLVARREEAAKLRSRIFFIIFYAY